MSLGSEVRKHEGRKKTDMKRREKILFKGRTGFQLPIDSSVTIFHFSIAKNTKVIYGTSQ
jgi:hypothetical protein